MELDALVLLLHQPYAIFFKKDNRLYIKFEAFYWSTFFPNVGYFTYKFIIRNFDIMLSFISKT